MSGASGFTIYAIPVPRCYLLRACPPRVVMDVLGHSQIAITMDLYAHVMPTALREAADAIDRALG